MAIDDFSQRLLDIMTEMEAVDVREPFRREQIHKLLKKKFPEMHDITINGFVDQIYSAVYEEQ